MKNIHKYITNSIKSFNQIKYKIIQSKKVYKIKRQIWNNQIKKIKNWKKDKIMKQNKNLIKILWKDMKKILEMTY